MTFQDTAPRHRTMASSDFPTFLSPQDPPLSPRLPLALPHATATLKSDRSLARLGHSPAPQANSFLGAHQALHCSGNELLVEPLKLVRPSPLDGVGGKILEDLP